MKGATMAAVLALGLLVACGGEGTESDATGGGMARGGGGGSTSASAEGGSSSASGPTGAGGGSVGGAGGGALTVTECYADAFVSPPQGGPDYDQFSPTVGSHCLGTNHQDIAMVDRVVFLGDSVTVGTPPQLSADFYRSQLADALASELGLTPPNLLWKSADPFNGTAVLQESGNFASCAKWGARTDDLLPTQLPDCFPEATLGDRTLVVMTMGGNDINALAGDAIDGMSSEALWTATQDFVQRQRDALDWLLTPGRFPNGVFVVFANIYEFTDGTGDVESCDVSGLAGFDEPVPQPDELKQMVVWANEQFLSMAVDTQTDIIFMLEEFCGHGFHADDPSAPCYRGPGQDVWFDLTCIHPNAKGHDHITEMFMAVVTE